jgi:hypothetical protein
MKTWSKCLIPLLLAVPTIPASRSTSAIRSGSASAAPTLRSSDTKAALHAFVSRPLSFEANEGQTDPAVKFLSRGAGYTVFLTGQEAVLSLWSTVERTPESPVPPPLTVNTPKRDRAATSEWDVVRMRFVGGREDAPGAGVDELPARVDYFLGNDPAKWRKGVTTYDKVKYTSVYPGVDLVFYGNQERLEYDFIVAPGGSPEDIRLAFEGTQGVEINATGDLRLRLRGRDVWFHKPEIYQEDLAHPGQRTAIDGRYEIDAEDRVGFAIGNYDRAKPLVIDPVLQYSTYFGGSDRDAAVGVAIDSKEIWVAGTTRSADFPVVASTSTLHGGLCGAIPCRDVFVARFDPAKSGSDSLVYSAFVGGTNDDIAVNLLGFDPGGVVVVTGSTLSTDFPTSANAIQATYGGAGAFGAGDAFVFTLNPNQKAKKGGGPANHLSMSTYLGGSGDETAYDVALWSQSLVITGFTTSSNFPTTPGALQTACTNSPCYDAFVTSISWDGTAFRYSTFLGGTLGGMINSASGLAVDGGGNVYVAGLTASPDFPVTPGSYQTQCGTDALCNGSTDGFVVKLNNTGSAVLWGTFLGGSSFDYAYDTQVSFFTESVYVTGGTVSADFPVTPGGAQTTYGGGSGCATYLCGDAFVTKLSPDGTALGFSSFLGGSGDEGPFHTSLQTFTRKNFTIADAFYVVGQTNSANFPIVNALQPAYGGGSLDGFLAVLNESGALFSSTYLGGNGEDVAVNVSTSRAGWKKDFGAAAVAGGTLSTNFPVTPSAYRSTCGTDGTCNGGKRDVFMMMIADVGPKP